jgi:DNA polymerase-3 subunit alpha
MQKALRVFVRSEAPIESVARRLEPIRVPPRSAAGTGNGGDGEISVVLLLDAAEVEIKLPGRFKVSPQIAGALKAVPGVEHVEAL